MSLPIEHPAMARPVDANESFARLGFVVSPDLWSASELELAHALVGLLVGRYRSAEQAVVAAGVGIASVARQHPDRNPGVIAGDWENEPYIIGELIDLEPRFARLFSAPAIWACAAELLDCPPQEVVYHFANITRKPSGIGPAVGWHRDGGNRYFSAADHRTIRLLLPLQPMSEANGGTSVLPGSHLLPLDIAAADTTDAISPSVAPGSGLAIHADLLHGGSPNRSMLERDVVVIQFGVGSSELLHEAKELLSRAGREEFLRFNRARSPEGI